MSNLLDRRFESREELEQAAQAITSWDDYAVTTKSSSVRHLQCRRGGTSRNNHNLTAATVKVKRDPLRQICPLVIKAFPVGDRCWEVRGNNDQHTHAMMKDAFVFHQHRKLNEEDLATALKVLKVGTKPEHICEALRDTEGKSSYEGWIAYLGAFLDERAYEARYQYDSEKRLQSIFFAYPASIEKARCFPEVVLVDATYRRNQYHMPYVNIVGISNVGRQELMSFATGGAWITDEKLSAYAWIAECIDEVIWKLVSKKPGIIVVDYTAAALELFTKIFPDTHHLLCNVHLYGNFRKNCCKGFDTVDQQNALLKAVKKLINSRPENHVEEAHKEFLEIAKFSRKADDIVSYLNTMLIKKEQWVGAYTSRLLHVGTTTTSRVECAHAAIKDNLTSLGTISNAMESIDRYIRFKAEFGEVPPVSHEKPIDVKQKMQSLSTRIEALLEDDGDNQARLCYGGPHRSSHGPW
ncbi:hypothetical protein VTP01DRAFT_7291 [Rhizomucor pusillus]|uniref:uncharacterized protein n=1 Tax=Rhizomucor pusillus TaxID=4840 RepID=UPI0037420F47